jgi:hypothetical protein
MNMALSFEKKEIHFKTILIFLFLYICFCFKFNFVIFI